MMSVSPLKILSALRNAHAQRNAPIDAAEATLKKAERALYTAQQSCIDATKILIEVDKTAGSMINPMRRQAQQAYDDAQATQNHAQQAVTAAIHDLITAYTYCASAAYPQYVATMQTIDPAFRDPRTDADAAHPAIAVQPPLFVEKPDIKGKKQ